jgi:hypothetical protein
MVGEASATRWARRLGVEFDIVEFSLVSEAFTGEKLSKYLIFIAPYALWLACEVQICLVPGQKVFFAP